MDNRLKFGLGILFFILGVIILINDLFYTRFLPGAFISMAIGIMLILDSRRNQ